MKHKLKFFIFIFIIIILFISGCSKEQNFDADSGIEEPILKNLTISEKELQQTTNIWR